jgi:hypothetical protein
MLRFGEKSIYPLEKFLKDGTIDISIIFHYWIIELVRNYD